MSSLEVKFNEAIELLKEFAFYDPDGTLKEHLEKAYRVQEFLKTTPAKDWVEAQLRLAKCGWCEVYDECKRQDGICDISNESIK